MQANLLLKNHDIIICDIYNLNNEYNLILLNDSIEVKQGSMVYVDFFSTGRIALNSSDEAYYSDLRNFSNSLFRINDYKNMRFVLNVQIDSPYFFNEVDINKNYEYAGAYKIAASSSLVSISRKIEIENCKNFFFLA